MSEFVSAKFVIIAGVGVLAVCMWLSISLAQALTAIEATSASPLFPRSMDQGHHSTGA